MTDQCFISYSTADALDFARKLANKLEGGTPSIPVWFDKDDLRLGDDWDTQIDDALKTCKVVLFVISTDSVTDNSVCKQEWSRALSYKKPIIPLWLQNDVNAPFRIGDRQRVDFRNNFDRGLAQLREHITWMDSPEGELRSLKDRLADAQRDLRRADLEDQPRIQAEIDDLKAEIKASEVISRDPDRAKKQTRKNINAGLERDRQPLNPVTGKVSSKFVNPRPGSIPDYFEGRFVETEEIADFLRNDFQQVMTITGRAGSGKTVLACRVFQYLENGHFPNELGEFKIGGIVYLSEISNYRANVANIFLGLLQLIEPQKANEVDKLYKEAKLPVDEKIRALLAALPTEPVILLLDNFEDLLDSNDAINDQELQTSLRTILQTGSHRLKVLITTRMLPRQLNMFEPARQYILHLEEGLPYPFAENVLRKMDKDGHAGFRDASDELLGRVREATLGYPRALESLYAILRVDRYSSVEELLVEGLPETVVEKYVGEAYSRLDPTSQKIIQTLAIYNRPVSYAAVDFALQFHVPGINSAPVLERLVSMHFVRREAKRYFLHPADRDYALSRMLKGDAEKRIGQGARARTWDQHSLTLRAADYFVEVRKPRTAWKKLDDLAAQLAEFELRCAASDYDTAAHVLTDIDFDYLLLWGHYRLLIDLHESLQGKLTTPENKRISAGTLGIAYYSIGEVRVAIKYYEQVLELAQEAKNKQHEEVSLGNLGSAYNALGDVRKAIEFFEQALVIDREIGDRKGEGADLGNLGNSYYALGDVRKAIKFFEQALVIDREIADRGGEATDLGNLGSAYNALGDLRKAIEFNEQALFISRAIGDRRGEGGWLSNLGSAHNAFGDERRAIGFFEQALFISRAIGERRMESQTLVNSGDAYLSLAENQKALANCYEAIQIADEILFPQVQLSARLVLVESYLFQNDLDNAHVLIEPALQYNVPRNNYNATALRGIISVRQGDVSAARQSFTRAIAQSDKILTKTPEYYSALDAKGLALCGLALFDGKQHVPAAIETFRAARKIAPHVGVVKRVLRLFDELVKCDEAGVLAEVRKAAEGSEIQS